MRAARILIIEDDPPSRELAAYLLDCAGFRTLLASDGAQGLQIAVEEGPDLVICDLQLPRLSGYEVARRLRRDSKWRRVSLIAVSAFSMPGDMEKALEAGFDAYIPKPITPQSFAREIATFLAPGLRANSAPD